MRLGYLIGLVLLLWGAEARADVISLGVALVQYAWATATISTLVTVASAAFGIVSSVYGSSQAKKAARAAEAARIASLEDRRISAVSEDSPHRYIYGRARVGIQIIDILTSGNKDQYKYIVGLIANHRCEAVGQIYIAGLPVGTLTADGYATASDFVKVGYSNVIKPFSGNTYTLPPETALDQPIRVFGAYTNPNNIEGANSGVDPITFTRNGNVITVTQADYTNYTVAYAANNGGSQVKIKVHLGIPGDPADAMLRAEVPNDWPATSRVTGCAYVVVRLDLNNPMFQSGIPTIEVETFGKLIADPRNNNPANYSSNAARVIFDYLRSPFCNVPTEHIPLASFIAATNECDETYSNNLSKYVINGVVLSSDDQTKVLAAMAEAMAGTITATTWDISPGKWRAPVMTLAQSDVIGSFAINPGISDSAVINGFKGQFVDVTNGLISRDYTPYQNATYRAQDGRDEYGSKDFPYTIDLQRVHQLCRIKTEDQRNGYSIQAEFNLKAWGLKIGQRFTAVFPFIGVNRVFRVTDKEYTPAGKTKLTFKEDTAEIWDEIDAVTPDATPNTTLRNPFAIDEIAPITLTSGTSTLLKMGDGTINSRIYVSYGKAVDSNVLNGGLVVCDYYRFFDATGAVLRVTAPGDSTGFYIDNVKDGDLYSVRVRNFNPSLNVYSPGRTDSIVSVGKRQPPSDVVGFTAAATATGIQFDWARCPDVDFAYTELRLGGTNFATGQPNFFNGDADSYTESRLNPGTYVVWAKHFDTTGNQSANDVSTTVTVSPAQAVSWSNITGKPLFADVNASVTTNLIGTKVTVIGNTISPDNTTNYNDWSGSCHSSQPMQGACYATAIAVGGSVMFGLNQDAISANGPNYWQRLDCAIYLVNDGTMSIVESGVTVYSGGSWVPGDVFAVKYDGYKIKYTKNGALVRTLVTAPNLSFYFDSAFAFTNVNLRAITYGLISDVGLLETDQLVPSAVTDVIFKQINNFNYSSGGPAGPIVGDQYLLMGFANYTNPSSNDIAVQLDAIVSRAGVSYNGDYPLIMEFYVQWSSPSFALQSMTVLKLPRSSVLVSSVLTGSANTQFVLGAKQSVLVELYCHFNHDRQGGISAELSTLRLSGIKK